MFTELYMFFQVAKDVDSDQARRIFESCDQVGREIACNE